MNLFFDIVLYNLKIIDSIYLEKKTTTNAALKLQLVGLRIEGT